MFLGGESRGRERGIIWDYSLSLSLFPPPLQVLEVHINDIRGITIHISYSENHDLTLMLVFYYFYMSPLQTSSISLIRVTFSISSPFDVTKLQKTVLTSNRLAAFRSQFNGHAYSYPLPPLWRWGLNLELNGIKKVIIHLSVPENYGFDTIISEYFYRLPFLYGC